MSGYVRSTDLKIEFDGDTVTGKLAPLGFEDLLKLESSQVATDEEAAAVLAKILPAYVTDFAGLKDAAGNPVTIQEVCSTAYFGPLSMEIGRKLIDAAKVARPKKPSDPSAS